MVDSTTEILRESCRKLQMMLYKEKLFAIHFTSYYSIPGRVTIMRVSDPIWISYPPNCMVSASDMWRIWGGGGDSSTSRKVHIAEEKNCQHTHTHNMSILWCAFVSSDHCFDSSTWMILGEFLKVVKLRRCVVLPLPPHPHAHTTSFIHSSKFNSSPLK